MHNDSAAHEDIEDLRRRIDEIDAELVGALNRRFRVVREIGEWKRRHAGWTFSPEREAALLDRLAELNQGPMPESTLRAIFREILSGARALEQPLRIAFLGPVATFTHQAAMARFGHAVEYRAQPTVADVFEAVERGQVEYGVVPVENSTEGAVTYTLDMLVDTSLKICAEIHMPIHHNLLSLSPPERIEELYSHPQVFGQCRRWLHRNLPEVRLIEVSSTAEACSRARTEPRGGAIAGDLAARQYELPVQEARIEDFSDNLTRFYVLGRQEPEPTGDDKTSVLFVIRDRVGALYETLAAFREYGINLTFIESRPSRRKRWEYFFFVDFIGHVADAKVRQALERLGEHCQLIKILGSYPRAADTVSLAP